jgi:hypothetical protein
LSEPRYNALQRARPASRFECTHYLKEARYSIAPHVRRSAAIVLILRNTIAWSSATKAEYCELT